MTASAEVGSTFSVSVRPSGRTFSVEADETLLAAAIRQGIGLPYGCKDGACGSCKCRLIEGQVTHRDYLKQAMSPEEAADHVLTCRATTRGNVVIESRQVTEEGSYPARKMPARVNRLEKLSEDVMRLTLQLPANDTFRFQAGQYVDILLRDGERRSYSMSSAPAQTAFMELHIRHMPGGKFTDHVFGSMREKEILRIEGPYGSFQLRHKAPEPVIMLASGTGFAPIQSMLQDLKHQASTRAVQLYWGGRRPADLYMHDWLLQFCADQPWLQYIPVVSDPQPADQWQGRTGFVHLAVLQDHPSLSGFQVYACGAPAMVSAAHADFVAAGLPDELFFADAFTSLADRAAS